MGSKTAVIAIDVGGTGTKGAIVNRDGEILLRVERPTDPSAGTKSILTAVEELLQRSDAVDAEVGSVGIGAAGFIDARSGSVTFAPNLVYDDPHVAAAVHAQVGLPVVVDNDANAAAWGERAFGTAVGSDNVVMLTLGTGIGSGIIVDGRLVRGHTGAGAELGHTVVNPDGPLCNCGLRGCLEQFASGQAIARMGMQAAQEDPDSSIIAFSGSLDGITAEHVAKAARQLDEPARAVMREAGRYLGIGMSNVANLFDPEIIVLTGGVLRAGEPYLGPARDTLAAMTDAQRRRPMRLDKSSLDRDTGILGAAALAFDEAKIPE
ncbi:MAG TPA: ROK family glucokinase [Actinomycetota bacterium]|nr:ROK family glucokinase [Actinomycetota bacterium]